MLNKLKKTKEQKSDQGFTIIEVMIVLAIAGLILLIVFLAVPALQRNGRNTQRKNDASSVAGGIATFVSNNNGALPVLLGKNALGSNLDLCSKGNGGAAAGGATVCTAGKPFETAKLGYYVPTNIFVTPQATTATVAVGAKGSTPTAASVTIESMTIITGASCNEGTVGTPDPSSRSAVVMYVTESASGDGSLQCVEQ